MINICFYTWDANSELIPKHPKYWSVQALNYTQSENQTDKQTNKQTNKQKNLTHRFGNVSRIRNLENVCVDQNACRSENLQICQEKNRSCLCKCAFGWAEKVSLWNRKINRFLIQCCSYCSALPYKTGGNKTSHTLSVKSRIKYETKKWIALAYLPVLELQI